MTTFLTGEISLENVYRFQRRKLFCVVGIRETSTTAEDSFFLEKSVKSGFCCYDADQIKLAKGGGEQCDQITRLYFQISQFTMMKICPIA